MNFVLILGANSDIAKAIANIYSKNSFNIYLAGRNISELEANAKNIEIRYGNKAKAIYFDALDFKSHKEFYRSLDPKPIGVICVVGYLGDPKLAQSDFEEASKIINTNYTGCTSILNIIADAFETEKAGFIVGISSCAGDRGRASNYIYGSAKGAFSLYLSGLRNRLSKHNIPVLTVKPGFVATKMTEDLDLPRLLTATPEIVAEDIFKAQQSKKNILYTKWYWWFIMVIIKNIPEVIFKKMNL